MVNFKIELRLDPGTPSTAGPSPAGDGVSFGQDVVPKLNAIGTGGIGSTVTISPAGSQPDSILFSNINLGRGIDPGGTISFLFPVTSTLTTGPAAVYFLLTPNPSPPVITRQPESQKVAEGAEVSLEVDATGAGQLTYQWKKDGLARPGATNRKYTIPNFRESDAGSYSVDVSNSEGTTTSRTATLAFNNEGQYLGDGRNPQLTVAVIVRQDDTGTVIAHDRQNNVAIQQPIRVRGDRTFTEDGPITLAPAAGQARGATVSGRIASGQVSGELGAARLPFTAIRDAAATGAAPFQAGYYLARALGTAEGATYAVVGPSGRITVVTSSVSSADSAAGLLNALGQLAATTTNGAQLAIALNAQFKTFEATLRPAGIAAPIPFLGLLDGILASARLVNLSILTSLATPGDTFTIGR
jgi:hypothetical protein